MKDSFDSLDNLESQMRKASVVQERAGLVAVHMYKQFLDYQQSSLNTENSFLKIIDTAKQVTDYLRQSFSVRNMPIQNINFETDSTNTVIVLNVLWHTMSFTCRYNSMPKALPQSDRPPLFCGRIFAVNGDYNKLLADVDPRNFDEQIKILIENEIASLYLPAEKIQHAIMTIKHKDNQEVLIGQADAPRDFLLKVVEIVCAGGNFHEQGAKKSLW